MRESNNELVCFIRTTKEVKKKLSELKKKLGKSMAQIVIDLINKKYDETM